MSGYRQVKVNLKPEDYNQLMLIAEEQEMTLAAYIRFNLNLQLEDKERIRRNKVQHFEIKKADPQLLKHLAYISNNINQIAHKLNAGEQVTRLILATLLDIKEELEDYRLGILDDN